MASKKLYMSFKSSSDATLSLVIDDPREDLTALEVKAAMDAIINTDVLGSKKGKITSVHAAKIVEQTVTELEI